jgi:hypothetical protein
MLTALVRQSLLNLNQTDGIDRLEHKYVSYLQSEMFSTLGNILHMLIHNILYLWICLYFIGDLRLAVEDKESWSDLQLPVRLKLEMKKLLHTNFETKISTQKSPPRWRRCFSQEYDSHYYLNTETNETQWELPDGGHSAEEEGPDDLSPQSTLNMRVGVGSDGLPLSPGRRVLPTREEQGRGQMRGAMNSQSPLGIDGFYSQELSFEYGDSPAGTPPNHLRDYSSRDPSPRAELVTPSSPPRAMVINDAVAVFETDSVSSDADLDENEKVMRLVEMGFSEAAALIALEMSEGSLASAAAYLVADAKATNHNENSREVTSSGKLDRQGMSSGKSGKLGLPRLILGGNSAKSNT